MVLAYCLFFIKGVKIQLIYRAFPKGQAFITRFFVGLSYEGKNSKQKELKQNIQSLTQKTSVTSPKETPSALDTSDSHETKNSGLKSRTSVSSK